MSVPARKPNVANSGQATRRSAPVVRRGLPGRPPRTGAQPNPARSAARRVVPGRRTPVPGHRRHLADLVLDDDAVLSAPDLLDPEFDADGGDAEYAMGRLGRLASNLRRQESDWD